MTLLEELKELNKNIQEMRWEIKIDCTGKKYVWMKSPVQPYACDHRIRSGNAYHLPKGMNLVTLNDGRKMCGFCHSIIEE